MTLLVTESNFHSHDNNEVNSSKKKRRTVDAIDITESTNNSDSHNSIMINPVTQQFNKPNMVAPDFNCGAIVNNGYEFIRIQLSNLLLQYKAVVLFFYGSDL